MNGLSGIKADEEVGGVIVCETVLVSQDLLPVRMDIVFVLYTCRCKCPNVGDFKIDINIWKLSSIIM